MSEDAIRYTAILIPERSNEFLPLQSMFSWIVPSKFEHDVVQTEKRLMFQPLVRHNKVHLYVVQTSFMCHTIPTN